MRALSLLLLSAAASALHAPPLNYQNVWRPAAQRQALVMTAGSTRNIPELVAVYELVPFMQYSGWEADVGVAEDRWAKGENMAASIQITVEKMRRKQRLHEGERSDVVLQVLDDVKRGLTYDGWEADVQIAELRWAKGENMAASIQNTVEKMRRQQRLHDSRQESISE